jgi:hypothetical protein
MSNGMLFEEYATPGDEDSRQDWCLKLVKKCPNQIVFGNSKIAADIYKIEGIGAAVGLFELEMPHDPGQIISAFEINRCAVVMIFKNRQSIDIMREWLKHAEDAIDDSTEES